MQKNKLYWIVRDFINSVWFLLLFGLALILFSIFVWKQHERNHLSILTERIEIRAEALVLDFDHRYTALQDAILQFATNERPSDQTQTAAWEAEAAVFLDAFEDIIAVVLIDPDNIIRAVTPEEGYQSLVGQPARNNAASLSVISLYSPIMDGEGISGFLYGLVNYNSLILPGLETFSPEFILQVSRKDEVIFQSDDWQAAQPAFITSRMITLSDSDAIAIDLAPSTQLLDQEIKDAMSILWIGVGFSCIAIIAIYAALRSVNSSATVQSHYQNLLAQSQDAIFVINQDGRYLDANPSAVKLVGYSLHELKKMTIEDLQIEDQQISDEEIMKLHQQGGIIQPVLRHKEGHAIPVEMSVSPVQAINKQPIILGIVRDISERQFSKRLVHDRLGIIDFAAQHSLEEVMRKILDDICALTGSKIGFFHFLEEDQVTLSLQAWSTLTAEKFCQAESKGAHYPVDQAGVWTEAIHARQPVIHNDYQSLPNRKGLPEGHADLVRELVVPVLRQETIVAILGIGNKAADYTQDDVRAANYLADVGWEVVEIMKTDRSKEQQQDLLEAIYANAPLLMLVIDSEGKIQQINDHAVRYFKDLSHDAITYSPGMIMPCFNQNAAASECDLFVNCSECKLRTTLLDTLERGMHFQKVETQMTVAAETGERQISFLLSSTPLKTGKQTMALLTLLDITESVHAGEQIQHLLDREIIINQLSQSLGKNLDLASIYRTISDHIRDLFHPHHLIIYAYDPISEEADIEFLAQDGKFINSAQIPKLSTANNVHWDIYQAVHTGQPFYAPDQEQVRALRPHRFLVKGEKATLLKADDPQASVVETQSALCLPMKVMGDIIGVMRLESKQANAFTDEDIDLLAGVASISAVAVQNIRTIETLEEVINKRTVELKEKVEKLDKSQKAMLYMVEDLNETAVLLADEREKLARSNQELEAFSYSVSHDLRAPLRHINGYIDLLLKKFPDSLPEKGQHYLETIVASTKDMGQLIDDLLNFSQTSRQELHKTRLDMNKLVEAARTTLKSEWVDRIIKWEIAPLPQVSGDSNLMKTVWMNLLSNAIKFTSQKENAQITIGCIEAENQYIFHVKDDGVGFDMAYAHKLFGVFHRLHSTKDYEGTGIGLASLRRIIQRHGGDAWAESEPDQGAVFYFSLPKN